MPSEDIERLRAALAGRYAVDRLIGTGGMAKVYAATDTKHGRTVALKVLRPDLAAVLGAERFHREIGIAATLQHPHIVPLYDSGDADGLLYYVMPLVEGETLRARLNREKQLPLADVVQITREVSQALGYAHARGIVHRDIKPENVMLSGTTAVVTDFGIARALSAAGSDRLTETGLSVGTPAYMSPEQAMGEAEVDGRADVYSLGCVLYEMLTGQPPFTGATAQAILARHSVDQVPSVRTVRGTIPPAVEQVIGTALAKVPADRYATGHQLADALVAAASGAVRVAGGPWWRRRGVRVGLGAAAIVAAAALGGLVVPWAAGPGAGAPAATPMLAVLPYDNLGAADDGYFAEGITDEITTRLANVSGLGVISRSSAFQFRERAQATREIGRALGADYVLLGSIRTDRRADGSGVVRVTSILVSVADDREIWSRSHDAALVPGEIFQAQEAIASGVTAALNVTLLPPERAALEARPTASLPAYEAYLRGNVHAAQTFAEEPTRTAIALFEQAIALDSGFALAHARLAQVQSLYYRFFDRRAERLAAARASAERALALAPGLSDARLALGYYYYWGHLDLDRAMEQFDAVRAAEPNNSELLWIVGSVERRLGRWDASMASMSRAQVLNPRLPLYAFDLAVTYMLLRRYPDAERYYDEALALEPNWFPPYPAKAALYWIWRYDVERARAVMREARGRFGETTVTAALLSLDLRQLFGVLGAEFTESLAAFTLATAPVDSAAYYLTKAEWGRWRGEADAARAYYDSARAVMEPRVRARPGEAPFRVELALAYAGGGRPEEALRETRAALDLVPSDAYEGPVWRLHTARITGMTPRREAAAAELARLLEIPSPVTRAMLRHPGFAPLRGTPAFDALLADR